MKDRELRKVVSDNLGFVLDSNKVRDERATRLTTRVSNAEIVIQRLEDQLVTLAASAAREMRTITNREARMRTAINLVVQRLGLELKWVDETTKVTPGHMELQKLKKEKKHGS